MDIHYLADQYPFTLLLVTLSGFFYGKSPCFSLYQRQLVYYWHQSHSRQSMDLGSASADQGVAFPRPCDWFSGGHTTQSESVRLNETFIYFDTINVHLLQLYILIKLCYTKSSKLSSQIWHPTPLLLPGKSHRWRSLEDCSPWGH